ncbi:MAG: DUF485 domain-containing protein [Planctomycetota bacterium]
MTDSASEPSTSTSIRTGPSGHGPTHTSRLGLGLFAAYSLLYLGFVLINAFKADAMDMVIIAGMNLAIVYGFGLIIVAIVLALIYGLVRRDGVDAPDPADDSVESST